MDKSIVIHNLLDLFWYTRKSLITGLGNTKSITFFEELIVRGLVANKENSSYSKYIYMATQAGQEFLNRLALEKEQLL